MAKAPRMKMDRQWQNIGANAYRSRIPLERVLTSRPSIDALIREGWGKAERSADPLRSRIDKALLFQP